MRGFLGEPGGTVEEEEQIVFGEEDVEAPKQPKEKAAGPEPYDLVYVLDALYHFPPSRGSFVASVLPNLRHGGVLAYTDILAPPSLSAFPGRLLANLLSLLLRVPTANLVSGLSLEEYKAALESTGYTAQVEDWTTHVFPGLAANLKARGRAWSVAGWLAEKAVVSGWKYVAVRAQRPPL
jgi:SAM-dependent methyltransferase